MRPNDVNAYANRGEARYHIGHLRGAITDFTTVIQMDEEEANAYYNRGITQYDLRNECEAKKDLEMAFSLNHPGAQEAIRNIDYSIRTKK